jgi:hypothetical protein
MAIAYSNTKKLCIDCGYYVLDRGNRISIEKKQYCKIDHSQIIDIKTQGCKYWIFYDCGIP